MRFLTYLRLVEDEMLLEDRVAGLQQRFLPILQTAVQAGTLRWPSNIAPLAKAPKDIALTAQKLFDYIVSVDPDPKKRNSQWLLTLVTRKADPMPFEDLHYASESLNKFAEMKQAGQLPANKGDINRYRSLSDLNFALEGEKKQQVATLASQEQEMLKQTNVIYDGPDYRVLSLLTQQAAVYFGGDTEWCTAWGGENCRHPTRGNMFNQYIKQGPVYVIFDKKTNNKWQFSFAAEQYMDVNDRSINLIQFFQEHPKVKEVFDNLEGEPIGEIAGVPVYKTSDGYVIKTQRGVMGKALFRAQVDAQNNLANASGRWISDYERGNESVADAIQNNVLEFFTSLKIIGDSLGEAICDLFYRDRRWGTVQQLAQPFLRLGERDLLGQLEWRQVKTHTMQHLLLVMDQNALLEATIDEGVFSVIDASRAFTSTNAAAGSMRQTMNAVSKVLNPAVSSAITELLLSEDVTAWANDSGILASDLTTEDAARLIEAKPKLGGIPLAYKVHGPSDAVKEMIVDWCDQEDLSIASKNPWIGNDLVIERFKDIDALVDDLGNDGAKWFAQVLSGNTDLEYYEAEGDVDDLVRALKPESLTCLGTYLQRTYESDIEDNFDEYDPSSIDDVLEVLDYVSDDAVQGAANSAAETGRRYGAEKEMSEMLTREIEKNSHIVLLKNDGTVVDKSGHWAWDAPCALVVSIEEIIREMGDVPDDLAYEISHAGWADKFEATIELEEPHYGFTDFDDEGANETFDQEIHELCHVPTEPR